jgi:hypothetical protein
MVTNMDDQAGVLRKTCTRCLKTFPAGDFPSTSCHGKLLVRSWCRECLKAYHRAVYVRRKRKSSRKIEDRWECPTSIESSLPGKS